MTRGNDSTGHSGYCRPKKSRYNNNLRDGRRAHENSVQSWRNLSLLPYLSVPLWCPARCLILRSRQAIWRLSACFTLDRKDAVNQGLERSKRSSPPARLDIDRRQEIRAAAAVVVRVALGKSAMIHPVILSGGTGTGLWPLSRTRFPKQFPLIVTDHDGVDYDRVVRHARLIVDTRNATAAVAEGRDKIVKA